MLMARLTNPDEAQRTERYLAALDKLMPADVVHHASGMVYGEQTKYLSYHFDDTPFDTLELLQFTDAQFGHTQCRYDRMQEYRDWVLAEPNRFLLWTGDNLDAASMLSRGTPWENLCAPDRQVYRFCEFWAPARHRILGHVGGNHERRPVPMFGDLGTLISTLLRVPYSAGQQFIDVYFGQHQPFKISLWHGTGGARTKGTIAQKLQRYMQGSDSQLFLMGHLHQPLVLPDWKPERGANQRLRLKKVVGAVGSSFLELWNTYAEIAGYAPGEIMMPRAILERNGHWEVTLR